MGGIPCKEAVAAALFRAVQGAYPEIKGLVLTVAEIAGWLEKPPQPEFGDFALPCFRLSKPLRAPPPVIASQLAAALEGLSDPWIKSAIPDGAFLNIFANQSLWSREVLGRIHSRSMFSELKDRRRSDREIVMIEYSQPNTHKEFHVGHLRNIALGDSLRRMFQYAGDDVLAVNYIGDEGAHVAKCLWYMQRQKMQPPAEDRGTWLGEVYSEASRTLASQSEAERKVSDAAISQVLRQLEAKSGEAFELWKETKQWSMDLFLAAYAWLDVHFDHYFFESEMTEEAQAIVDKYLDANLFVRSEGAVGMDLKDHKLGFFLLRKRDGMTLYATKDLALARRKFEDFKVDHSIYVVAAEQQMHFRQVFKTLELMGFQKASRCFHLSYGLVMLPDGKMSSRAGTAIPYRVLQESMLTELRAILRKYEGEWSETEREEVAHRLCVGAIKYGMIGSDPVKNIVFDMKEWLSFEGNSGPYLMYCYTRAMSILRKAKDLGHDADFGQTDLLVLEEERDLVRYFADFNQVVFQGCREHKPSLIAIHLFNLCRSFNRFYANVSVMKADTPHLIGARLALIESFAALLKEGLYLIGITPPDRM